ncbi:hypothetical protein [Agromyces sp. LHK192]|uniref:hypothetical protein n=1 Tax=Agromyces sp. LHK192 TaxID=2498704 RepID=UPI000FD6C2F9|nr:hypothetical protein [Agromyces sp. LHK192]
MATKSNGALEARIAELEAQNEVLRRERDAAEESAAAAAAASTAAGADASKPARRRSPGRWRAVVSFVLVLISVVLAPVALISAWARIELVDTDRFVATFAPLAEDPAVQRFLADEITDAVEAQVDIDQLTSDVFDGIRSLDLPPRAADALALLEQPAAQGIKSLLDETVTRIVQAPAFADTWAAALRFSHRQFVQAMQGDESAAVQISGKGELQLQLGPIIDEVKERLVERGIGFAASIPEVQLTIVLAQSDGLVLVQTLYALAVGVGTWLPWVVVAMLVAGVLIARNRPKALLWTAIAFAFSMLTLVAGFGIGRMYFLATVSPSIMPADAAGVMFDGLTEIMRTASTTLLVLGVLVAVIAWCTGPWSSAVKLRGFARDGFDGIRARAARDGITTGAFGTWLDRWRVGAYVVITVIAALVILFVRPLSVGLVVWTVVLALVALLLVQLLRRPAGSPEPPDDAAGGAAGDGDTGAPHGGADPVDQADAPGDTRPLPDVDPGRADADQVDTEVLEPGR